MNQFKTVDVEFWSLDIVFKSLIYSVFIASYSNITSLDITKKNTQTVNRMAENDYPGNNLLLVKMEKKVTEEWR